MQADARPPFHLAVPVDDLEAARGFYCSLIGSTTGRTASRWIDLDFFGHQVTLHLVDGGGEAPPANAVDGDDVPARHFGVVLPMDEWRALADRLDAAGVDFLIAPRVRFRGEPGEQATFFIQDPAGNVLEFKSFDDPSLLFATGDSA